MDEDLFESAANFVRLNVNNISKDNLLYLYARYKQSTEGACNTIRPSGLFNFEAKSKYDAWKSIGDKMSKEAAMSEYVERVDSLFSNWRTTSSIRIGGGGGTFGHQMSTMRSEEGVHFDDKNLFDWFKEWNINEIKKIIDQNKERKEEILSRKDEENGISLLIWACDLEQFEIVEYILTSYSDLININDQDNDGLTCLHYDICAENTSLVKELLKNKNINVNLVDLEGSKPSDIINNEEILHFFK